MKKIILFSVFLFGCSFSYSQSWVWVKNAQCDADIWPVSTDNLGNIYQISDYVSCTYSNDSTSSGQLTKFAPGGGIIWAVSPSFSFNVLAVCNDKANNIIKANNVFISGGLYAGFTYRSLTMPYCGYPGASLIKFDSAGNPLWGQVGYCPSRASWAYSNSVTTDKYGNVFSTGIFKDSVQFGSNWLVSVNDTNTLHTNTFLAKYSSSGALRWAKCPVISGNKCFCYAASVSTDNIGNSYVTGSYMDTVKFGGITLTGGNTGLNNNPYFEGNLFLVKYDSSGNVVWAKTSRQGGWASGVSDATDSKGNIYAGGYLSNAPVIFSGDTLACNDSSVNSFIIKYDSSGNIIWYKQLTGGPGNNKCALYQIAIDESDNVFMSGTYAPWFGHVEYKMGTDTLPKMGGPNTLGWGYIIELDSAGNYKCQTVAENIADGPNSNDLIGIAVDPYGNVIISGDASGDTTIFGIDTLIAYQTEFPFIAKWQPCGNSDEGINTIKTNQTISIFPNPFTNSTTVAVNTEGKHYLEVYDLTGRKLQSTEFTGKQYELSAQGLAKGMYFIRVFDGQNALIGTDKIVVE